MNAPFPDIFSNYYETQKYMRTVSQNYLLTSRNLLEERQCNYSISKKEFFARAGSFVFFVLKKGLSGNGYDHYDEFTAYCYTDGIEAISLSVLQGHNRHDNSYFTFVDQDEIYKYAVAQDMFDEVASLLDSEICCFDVNTTYAIYSHRQSCSNIISDYALKKTKIAHQRMLTLLNDYPYAIMFDVYLLMNSECLLGSRCFSYFDYQITGDTYENFVENMENFVDGLYDQIHAAVAFIDCHIDELVGQYAISVHDRPSVNCVG
jgi:hypothetical protein